MRGRRGRRTVYAQDRAARRSATVTLADLSPAQRQHLSLTGQLGPVLLQTPRQKRAQHAATGALGKRSGAAVQDEIAASCAAYRAVGRATIAEVHMKVAGAPGRMRPVEASTVDFMGVLDGGRAIAFDVKSCSSASFSLDARRGPEVLMRQRRQAEFLLDVRRRGGLAFFLLVDAKLGRCWVCGYLDLLLAGGAIAVRALVRAKQKGVASTVVDHLPGVERAAPLALAQGHVPAWDFLAIAERGCTLQQPVATTAT